MMAQTWPVAPGPSQRLGVSAALVGGSLVAGDVAIRDGEIEAIGLPGHGEGIAVPAMVDAQVNGYAGIDVLQADVHQLLALGSSLQRDGVGAYQPTLITAAEDETIAALRRIASLARHADRDARAAVIGVHLEGPFLSPQRPGAHPPEHLRLPDVRLLERMLDAGPVRTVTLAPELPAALELIALCVRRGVRVSLGHSDADAAAAAAAIRAGATSVTHLFNAMAPVSARAPGLAGFALSSPGCAVQLIADGVHVSDELIRVAFNAARGRVSLVSDAIAAATLADGRYRLGSVDVEVRDGVARREDGTLAGSTTPLAAGLARLRELGVDQLEALTAVSERPARLLGVERHGSLRLGGPADLVVVDERHQLVRVLSGGREVEPRPSGCLS